MLFKFRDLNKKGNASATFLLKESNTLQQMTRKQLAGINKLNFGDELFFRIIINNKYYTTNSWPSYISNRALVISNILIMIFVYN